MTELLIIGGSDAGISAALRAREIDPHVRPTVVVADEFPNFSICGLPFYLSGEVRDWRTLAHRTSEEIQREGVRLLIQHKAERIDPESETVTVLSSEGETKQLSYDRLVIATGAVSSRPRIEGLDTPGVYFLRWMKDGFAVQEHLTTKSPASVVIIGGGYIGMEMTDALRYRGISVTVVEYSQSVMETVDHSLGHAIIAELQRHGVTVVTGVGVERIEGQDDKLLVQGGRRFQAVADMALVAVGCQPMTDVATSAGVSTGVRGAIQVNRFMETNVSHVFAAGDCAETWHHVLNRATYLPLGTTAHKQGRIAGENAAGGVREFAGSLGTQVVKIFDLVVGRTGLRDSEALHGGFDPFTDELEVWDHKVYYPGAKKLKIRITGDRSTKRLLGVQIMGDRRSEVAKRIDVFATALSQNLTVEDLNDLDLSYTPPLSSPWDPMQLACQAWIKKVSS